MNFKDYYKILELEKNASQDDIKKQFRKLANKYHPDKNQGNTEAENRFKDISEAYEVLGDPEKRKKYDTLGSSYSNFKNKGGTNNEYDWSQWFSGNQGRRQNSKTVNDFFTSGGTMSDFFEKIFGQGYRTSGFGFEEEVRGEDHNMQISITMKEAFTGTKRKLKVNGETIEINIKAGIANGQVIKLTGKGRRGKNGGPNGDLLLTIKISESNDLERNGDDLTVTTNIDYLDAILGSEIYVETITGKFNLKVPQCTQVGKTFKLKGQGFPQYHNGNRRGDLYVKLNVTLPKEINDAEREYFQKLKDSRKKWELI